MDAILQLAEFGKKGYSLMAMNGIYPPFLMKGEVYQSVVIKKSDTTLLVSFKNIFLTMIIPKCGVLFGNAP